MKKNIILLTLLLSIFMIGAVSASATNTTNKVSTKLTDKTTNKEIVKKDNTIKKDVVNKSKKNKIGIKYTGTFDELSKKINNTKTSGTLNLEKNYKYTSGSKEGIKITKSITINGNGHTLNGNNQSRIFNVTRGVYLILKNLKFINGQGQNETINGYDHNVGGAIYAKFSTITITNSEFNNNQATGKFGYGGAIGIDDSTITITSSEFNNNQLTGKFGCGGAIYTAHSNITINSKFNNNQAGSGGAIYTDFNSTITTTNCKFNNNSANRDGGALYTDFSTITIKNSEFNNNYGKIHAGVLCSAGGNINIKKSTFTNNQGESSGVIGSYGSNINVTNSIFNNNYGYYDAGVIYNLYANISIKNSIFTNNTVCNGGGATICMDAGSYINMDNSIFTTNNKSNTSIFLTNGNNANIHNCIFIDDKVYCEAGNVDLSDCKNKTTTKLTATSKLTTTYNINKNLVITLKDNQNKPLSNTQINVKLDDETKKYKTNKKGQIRISTKKLDAKTYTTKITFNGNKKYLKSSTTTKVIIKKATPQLTAKNKNFKKSVKIKKYSITLNNNLKKPMQKVPVILKVNGKKYKVKTNNKGIATFTIKKLNQKGKFTATITYNGNKNYNKATKKVKLTIK